MNEHSQPHESLLHPFRSARPQPGRISVWQRAVLSELAPHPAPSGLRRIATQVMIILCGFALGWATRFLPNHELEGRSNPPIENTLPIVENSIQDATYQHIFVKEL